MGFNDNNLLIYKKGKIFMLKSVFNNIVISGITCAVPSVHEVLLEKYASSFGEESVNKFSKTTGVVSRYITRKGQTASDLAYAAAERLIRNKQIDVNSIEVLIFVSQTPDYRIPSTVCVLQKRLGLPKDSIAFDINLGCSGYVYGLQVISALLNSSNAKRGLLLVGDTSNRCISPEDRSSCMLFGEAGSATLVEKKENAPEIQMAMRTDGNGFKAIIVPAGAFRNEDASRERVVWGDGNIRSDYDLYMNGTDVFNFTISEVPALINEFMTDSNTCPDTYDSLILHQANVYILKQVMKKTNFPKEKTPISMDRYGNTSVASIPVTIADAYGNNDRGTSLNLLMCGFGVGLSWGIVSAKINSEDVYPIFQTDEIYTEGSVNHD